MSKLTDVLQSMIDEAARVAHPVKRKLKSGLHISIEAKIEHYIVEISRDSTYPSGKEWETIFKHWPYFTAMPNADQYQGADHRMALRGTVGKRQEIRMF